jgi:hypothetical protein
MESLYNLCSAVGIFGTFSVITYTVLAPRSALDICKTTLIKSTEFCIRAFTFGQQKYDNYLKNTITNISNYIRSDSSAKIIFVEDGIETDLFYNLDEYATYKNTISTYDFIIYKQLIDNKIHNIVLNNESMVSLSKYDPISNFVLEDIKTINNLRFIQIEIIFNTETTPNQKIKIDLFNPENYYIANNTILSKSFIQWYMQYHHKIQLPNTYDIRIIDGEIKIMELTHNDSIVFTETDYNILTNKTDNAIDTADTEDNIEQESTKITPIVANNSYCIIS